MGCVNMGCVLWVVGYELWVMSCIYNRLWRIESMGCNYREKRVCYFGRKVLARKLALKRIVGNILNLSYLTNHLMAKWLVRFSNAKV